MSDYQAGPSSKVADLARGKDFHPGQPYRRDMPARPGVVTGLTNRLVAHLAGMRQATTNELATVLDVSRKQVGDALKGLRQRGEIEYAREPKNHTEPRVWRLARPSLAPEQVQAIEAVLATDSPGPDPERMKASSEELVAAEPETAYVAPPTQRDLDDAIADLLAMHEGETGVDPVSAALNRVLLAAEDALACYLKHFNDPLRAHLERQVEEAHAAISAWEDRRRDRA